MDSKSLRWLGKATSFGGEKYSHKFGACLLSPGSHLMVPLGIRHSCAPAEVSHGICSMVVVVDTKVCVCVCVHCSCDFGLFYGK